MGSQALLHNRSNRVSQVCGAVARSDTCSCCVPGAPCLLERLWAAQVPPASPATVNTPPMTAQMAVRNLYSCLGCSATTI